MRNPNKTPSRFVYGLGLTLWQFQDRWIKQGLEGGKKAAYALRTAITEQCSGIDEDIEVIAKVVANVDGLSRMLHKNGYVDNPTDLKQFTLGFSQAKASFDFIDVGRGKERADFKIRGKIVLCFWLWL